MASSTLSLKKQTADYKVVLLGDADVGKTSLLTRYIDGVFKDSITSTIGASFTLKRWGDKNIALWDTAGEERFSGLSSFYCRGAAGALLCFDLTNSKSFEALHDRFIPLLENGTENCVKVVIGTKSDLIAGGSGRRVTERQAFEFTRTINNLSTAAPRATVPYYETSSLTGDNIDVAFQKVFATVTEFYPPKNDAAENDTVDLTVHGGSRNRNNQSPCNC
ncbi:ras-related protein Rab-20-like [Tubulanus polymorphus]|uniref:ras-related protein Rab-20-like n=1 Tax=Tubulanus polymorphus TaxID=672921 RepID=UPI003DA296D2